MRKFYGKSQKLKRDANEKGVEGEVYIRAEEISLLWRCEQINGWPKGRIDRLGRLTSRSW